jgi:hypothetical protein
MIPGVVPSVETAAAWPYPCLKITNTGAKPSIGIKESAVEGQGQS